MDIKKSANLLLNFAIKRLAEIFGILIFVAGFLLLIALISYSPEDPNFIFPDNTNIKNILGFQGSFISDLFFQSVGLISYLVSFTLILSGINILRLKVFFLLVENIFFTTIYCIFGTLFFSYFYADDFTLYINGNGGFVGNYFNQTFLNSLIQIHEITSFYILIFLISFLFLVSINFKLIRSYNSILKIYSFFFKKEEKNYTDKSEIINEYKVFSSENIKKLNAISRIIKSINYLIWGDV